MRLENTLVRYEGRIYRTSLEAGKKLRLISAETLDRHAGRRARELDSTILVDANDPSLDISSLPLGYVNPSQAAGSPRQCVFVSRGTYRQQIQGVHERNTRFLWENGTGQEMPVNASNFGSISYRALEDTVQRKFPSAKEAWDSVREGGWVSRAFHPNLAFAKLCSRSRGHTLAIRLRLNGHTIGYVSDENGFPRVCLSYGYAFLEDALRDIEGLVL